MSKLPLQDARCKGLMMLCFRKGDSPRRINYDTQHSEAYRGRYVVLRGYRVSNLKSSFSRRKKVSKWIQCRPLKNGRPRPLQYL